MTNSYIYLDTYLLQQDMRVRLPKAILSNMNVEKGKAKIRYILGCFRWFFDFTIVKMMMGDAIMSNQYSAISLFTGAGGMDIGFEKAGIKTVFANEANERGRTYNANHSNGVMVNDDINNVIDSLALYRGIDFVFGGPPC